MIQTWYLSGYEYKSDRHCNRTHFRGLKSGRVLSDLDFCDGCSDLYYHSVELSKHGMNFLYGYNFDKVYWCRSVRKLLHSSYLEAFLWFRNSSLNTFNFPLLGWEKINHSVLELFYPVYLSNGGYSFLHVDCYALSALHIGFSDVVFMFACLYL